MATVKDPVCEMQFDSSQARAQTIYKEQAYYFCSEECLRLFENDPETYLSSNSTAPKPEKMKQSQS